MYRLLRPALFAFDAERVHETAVAALAAAGRFGPALSVLRRWYAAPELRCRRFGLDFPGPIGLAAGFDKDARAVPALAALGFHFLEVGTVTPRGQAGNPRPRLFRMPDQQALVNRLGFNNQGAEAMASRLARTPRPVPLGINIGKNRDTAADATIDDYLTCLRLLYPYGDYFTVNLSSPNTPGLRDLQKGAFLRELLSALQADMAGREQPKPLLLKIAPDLDRPTVEAIVAAALDTGLAGLVVSNTWPHPKGGLSGRPLLEHNHRYTAAIYRIAEGKLPLVGVGGLFTGEDVYARLRAGASLVQVYTGFVYGGPSVPSRMARSLLRLLQRDGVAHLDEIVGVDASSLPDPWKR